MATPPLVLMTLPGSYESLSAHTRLHTPLAAWDFLEMTQRGKINLSCWRNVFSTRCWIGCGRDWEKGGERNISWGKVREQRLWGFFSSKSSHRDEVTIPVAQKNICSLILHDCIHSRTFSLLVTEASREILFWHWALFTVRGVQPTCPKRTCETLVCLSQAEFSPGNGQVHNSRNRVYELLNPIWSVLSFTRLVHLNSSLLFVLCLLGSQGC